MKTIKSNKKIEEEVPKKKAETSLKIVYLKDSTKEQFEITDNSLESRIGAIPVAPSNYAPGSINYKITIEDIEKYPFVANIARVGDIVDQTEFKEFTGQ